MLLVLLLLSGLLALSSGIPVLEIPTCPHIRCADPPCEDPFPTYMEYNGGLCRSCDACHNRKKRQVIQLPVDMCPIPMCAYPDPCSVPYEMSYFEYNGQQCPGCPYCPAGFGGLELS